MNYFNEAINSPWKGINEILMYAVKPFALVYLGICGINLGNNCKFYGFPKIFRYRNSQISIGKNFECRSWWSSSPLGINHPTIISTWSKDAKIVIGDDVGMSGGSIVSAKSIEVGNGTLIGANSTIIDTDFHPINSSSRRYEKSGISTDPVRIGKNVFIGMNCIILKGSVIPDNTVIPAGSVVTRNSKFK